MKRLVSAVVLFSTLINSAFAGVSFVRSSGITFTGADGITFTGADGITLTGADGLLNYTTNGISLIGLASTVLSCRNVKIDELWSSVRFRRRFQCVPWQRQFMVTAPAGRQRVEPASKRLNNR